MKVSAKRLYHEFAHATGFDELRACKGETAQKSATHKKSFNRIKRLFNKRVRKALKMHCVSYKECSYGVSKGKSRESVWYVLQ